MEFQLVLPGVHQLNAAGNTIQTWENNVIEVPCSTDTQFSIKLFYLQLKQFTLTSNLLRKSIRNPQISAYTSIEGMFYFNKTPLSSPG